MIDLAVLDPVVAVSAQRFNSTQVEFNRATDALNADLYAAFRRICPCSAGERIAISYSYNGRTREMEGRAVFMRNGTRMGLYVDVGKGQRIPVAEPYASNVRLIVRRRSPRPA